MALSVDFCDDTDFYRIFSIVSDAFGDDQPYIDAIFPSHHEHSGRIKGGERLLEMKRTDSTNRFLKATDTSTGEIIGLAKYIIFANGKPEESPLGGDLWKTTDEKEYAAQLYEQYLEPRRKVVRSADGPVIGVCYWRTKTNWFQTNTVMRTALDILTIDPNHQRRGAGRELMKWGVRMADEIGAEVIIHRAVSWVGQKRLRYNETDDRGSFDIREASIRAERLPCDRQYIDRGAGKVGKQAKSRVHVYAQTYCPGGLN